MSIEVGHKIVLNDGRQGIIKYINPRIETVNECVTGCSHPISVYNKQEVTVILTTGLLIRAMVKTGPVYYTGSTTVWYQY